MFNFSFTFVMWNIHFHNYFSASMLAEAANSNETEDPKDLSQEEMRLLLERNELVGGGSHLQPFDPSNVKI